MIGDAGRQQPAEQVGSDIAGDVRGEGATKSLRCTLQQYVAERAT